jgi:hypothetical protein
MIRSKRSRHVDRRLSSEDGHFLHKFGILQTADYQYSADSIDALVEIIISCLVLCFLLRYAGVRSSRDRRLRKRMLVVIRREENGLKLIANRAFYPQATYWSNVDNERYHEPH